MGTCQRNSLQVKLVLKSVKKSAENVVVCGGEGLEEDKEEMDARGSRELLLFPRGVVLTTHE